MIKREERTRKKFLKINFKKKEKENSLRNVKSIEKDK